MVFVITVWVWEITVLFDCVTYLTLQVQQGCLTPAGEETSEFPPLCLNKPSLTPQGEESDFWPLQTPGLHLASATQPSKEQRGLFISSRGEWVPGFLPVYADINGCKANIFSVMLEPGERTLCNVFSFSRRTFTWYFSQRYKLFFELSVCLFHHFQVELWVTTCCLWPSLADSRTSLPSCVFLFVSFACYVQHCREFRRAVVSLFICLTFWDKSLTMQP